MDKILSFNYRELADWIRARLHGDDGYFPVYEGHEPNLHQFLIEAFENIKDETFRENFLEILDDLSTELWGFTKDRKKIRENKNYIYELLSLCGGIKRFRNKNTLYRIARSGKLKGLKGHGLELHQLLLTTLASYHVAGDYHFWLEQMKDDSNKYYTNAAFYALINRKYDLETVFEHIKTFIDRFKGEITLVWGIRALINKYGKEHIIEGFQKIESKLSSEQKEAVNNAFIKADHTPVFQLDTVYYELKPEFSASSSQKVSEPTIQYGVVQRFEEKAGEIFRQMGFEVEFNRRMAGHVVDIFIKKKKTFGPKYECYICKCCAGNRKANRKNIDDLWVVLEAVRVEYDCDAVIIAEKGFTKEAVKSAQRLGIELKTLEEFET